MPTNKNLPPMQFLEDEIILGTGADAIRIKGKGLQLRDASTHVRGHYPDMYPWDTPHRHPEWDVRRSHACDLAFPPDNIPVAAIPGAIRELKRLAIGGWIVNAPVSDDLREGAVVRWDTTSEMWVAALASSAAKEPSCTCPTCSVCPVPPLPDSDLPPDVPNTPAEPEKLACTDFDPRLDETPSQAFPPEFMGIVIGANSVQTHGVVRHPSFNYPASTPLYLSATEAGTVTTENTGVFVGTVLVPGVLLLNVYAQVFDKYYELVKEELKSKITCVMEQLTAAKKALQEALEAGDAENKAAIDALNEFIATRLNLLQSYIDAISRQSEELKGEVEALSSSLGGRVTALESAVDVAESTGGKGYVVNTIAGRDELVNKPQGTVVFVRDATDDPTISSGPATYVLVGTGADGYWSNITSAINIDAEDLLGNIELSTLQNAIAKAHGHDNKALLDSISNFGDNGVKIGDVVIIKEDGTSPLGQLEEDVAELKEVAWAVALDEAPTEENFDEVTKDVPEGGFYTVPIGEDSPAALDDEPVTSETDNKLRRLFQKKEGTGVPVGADEDSTPDGVTIRYNAVGELVAIGGNLLLNSEQWITASGSFTAPVAGLFEVLLINGGQGGRTGTNTRQTIGGASGAFDNILVYLSAGESVAVTIGAGSPGVVTAGTNMPAAGGVTSFGGRSPRFDNSYPDIVRVSMDTNHTTSCPGGGPGGGRPTANPNPGRFYGAGGGAFYSASNSWAGDGHQGAVRLRWYDPAKASGPIANEE